MGHNSVNHQKKSWKKAEAEKQVVDVSNSIRHCGGKVDGENVGATLFQDHLTVKVDNHSPIELEGNTLHCWKGKQDVVISDAALVNKVQALKKLFDKGMEQDQLVQLKKLALEIEQRASH